MESWTDCSFYAGIYLIQKNGFRLFTVSLIWDVPYDFLSNLVLGARSKTYFLVLGWCLWQHCWWRLSLNLGDYWLLCCQMHNKKETKNKLLLVHSLGEWGMGVGGRENLKSVWPLAGRKGKTSPWSNLKWFVWFVPNLIKTCFNKYMSP